MTPLCFHQQMPSILDEDNRCNRRFIKLSHLVLVTLYCVLVWFCILCRSAFTTCQLILLCKLVTSVSVWRFQTICSCLMCITVNMLGLFSWKHTLLAFYVTYAHSISCIYTNDLFHLNDVECTPYILLLPLEWSDLHNSITLLKLYCSECVLPSLLLT